MYALTVEVDTAGAPAPTRSTISFNLPGNGTDADAVLVAEGIRKGFTDAYGDRARVAQFQQTGMTRDIALP
jgi:hypothetical protein